MSDGSWSPWWLECDAQEHRFLSALTESEVVQKNFAPVSGTAPDDELRHIFAEVDRAMREAVRRLLTDGRVDAWARRMHAILRDGHTKAYKLGRRYGGQSVENFEAEKVGHAVAEDEKPYLDRFEKDLRQGRYGSEGELDLTATLRRARMYQARISGTANWGFVEGSPDDTWFEWVDVEDERECNVCLSLADNGPYTKETLPTVPRAGNTPCSGYCRCELHRIDGQLSFEFGSGEAGAGAVYPEPPGATDDPPLPKLIKNRRYLDSHPGTSIEEFEDRIRSAQVEVFGIFSESGELLFAPIIGYRTRVPLAGASQKVLAHTIAVHNHPGGGVFSRSDYQSAAYYNFSRIIAVLPAGGRLQMDRPAKGWPPFKEIEKIYTAARNLADEDLSGKTVAQVRRIQIEHLNRAFAKAFPDNAMHVYEF